MLQWALSADLGRCNAVYDKTLTAECARSTAAVMTGAAASSLATLGHHVRGRFLDALPFPELIVDGKTVE
ncbi:hypothetical protein AB0B79_40650 [Streptomyces sp. NPDC039022]|uniref:hypothetical protein n=1 Tax=unclassified Streptomyces TaxID=2593676 RepID=UPI0033D85658